MDLDEYRSIYKHRPICMYIYYIHTYMDLDEYRSIYKHRAMYVYILHTYIHGFR